VLKVLPKRKAIRGREKSGEPDPFGSRPFHISRLMSLITIEDRTTRRSRRHKEGPRHARPRASGSACGLPREPAPDGDCASRSTELTAATNHLGKKNPSRSILTMVPRRPDCIASATPGWQGVEPAEWAQVACGTLNRYLLILKRLIFESSVRAGRPNFLAAPDGPEIRP
jgi:hypothetical protein